MNEDEFRTIFAELTGNENGHFPWQWALYQRFVSDRPDNIPDACTLPTGLGKTSVIALWLIALAHHPEKMPRRLVYVVNRRTVVDQSTREAEKLRENLTRVPEVAARLCELCAVPADPPLAISTLRGQYADNREWSADPSRPAIICGTVDMIGSRLLFAGYGVGFRAKPLHAGFLGQDVLLVHDEAHLEKPFQDLIEAIGREQTRGRTPDFCPIKVMALTATPRGGEKVFELTDDEKKPPPNVPDDDEPLHIAWRRLRAKKNLAVVPVADEKQIMPKIVELAHARGQEFPGSSIIIFVRTVDAATEVHNGLRAKKVHADNISALTGTMRGLERNRQADPRGADGDPVFARFLKPPKQDAPETDRWKVTPRPGTVYLVCTAAGEVGVDISADHLVCDLAPFDSLAQRFGRVNRYGTGDSHIDVVHESKPSDKKKDDPFDQRRWLSLGQLNALGNDASPHAIGQLPLADRIAAFTPTPTVLPTSDILFDAWALTTIRDKLPGRPKVEPYLHGIAGWEPPETHVAWREEVERITGDLLQEYEPEDLLADYPLKPHEMLREPSYRAFKQFEAMAKRLADRTVPVWLLGDEGKVQVLTLRELADKDNKERIEGKSVLLPPTAGGLKTGMLDGTAAAPEGHSLDVADEDFFTDREENRVRQRKRLRNTDPEDDAEVKDMHPVRTIVFPGPADDEDAEEESWQWFALSNEGDKSARKPVLWCVHVGDVERIATGIVSRLPLPDAVKQAVIIAARFHDHGKRRKSFQAVLSNFSYPTLVLAKSGKKGGRVPELYRHEFGSLVDLEREGDFLALTEDQKELVRHLIAVHHGRGRPHFPADEAFDPEHGGTDDITAAVPRRFARLQRKYGRWGLAYLESLLRAADYAASANPSAFVGDES